VIRRRRSSRTSRRFGEPEGFIRFADRAHHAGRGVILDGLPAHFPTHIPGLARFDGAPLYGHADPRRGFQSDRAGVSRPVETGGLGLGFKWNMGWMQDIFRSMALDPAHRRWHHDKMTFGQTREWGHARGLEWHVPDYPVHRGVQTLIRDRSRLYRHHPALHAGDCETSGSRWIAAETVIPPRAPLFFQRDPG